MTINEIIYLDKEDILFAHHAGFEQFGRTFYGFDDSGVEKRVIDPQTDYWGTEQYLAYLKKQLYMLIYTKTLKELYSPKERKSHFSLEVTIMIFIGFIAVSAARKKSAAEQSSCWSLHQKIHPIIKRHKHIFIINISELSLKSPHKFSFLRYISNVSLSSLRCPIEFLKL